MSEISEKKIGDKEIVKPSFVAPRTNTGDYNYRPLLVLWLHLVTNPYWAQVALDSSNGLTTAYYQKLYTTLAGQGFTRAQVDYAFAMAKSNQAFIDATTAFQALANDNGYGTGNCPDDPGTVLALSS